MTQKPTSAAEAASRKASHAVPIRVCVVTMDTHLASATARARPVLSREYPGLVLSMHSASEYAGNEALIARVKADIAAADIVVAGMLFLEDHFLPILDDLRARRHPKADWLCDKPERR